jgi:predicted transcriptional regulator
MTTPHAPEELADVLANQTEVLEALADDPATQRELGKKTGLSHSTAHRRVKVLEDYQVVEERRNKYELTEFGGKALDWHRRYLDGLGELSRRSAFLEELQADISLDSPILDGADVFFSDSAVIDAAGYKNKNIFENAVQCYGVLDGVLSNYFSVWQINNIVEKSVVILHEDLAETVLNTYEDTIRELLKQDFLEMYRTSDSVPYTSTVVETQDSSYAILSKHSDGRLVVNLQNDNPAAVKWVKERYQQFQTNAEPIENQAMK